MLRARAKFGKQRGKQVMSQARVVRYSALSLEALRRNIDTVTVAKCAKGYHFMQTDLPRCLNKEVVEEYNRDKFRLTLFAFYCLIENRFLYIKCKECSIDCTSALMFVLSILKAVQECY